MNYRSVCTGIAAETVAWHPLGWKALSFAEIDPFCNALLKYRYPEVLNYGDFTKIQPDGNETGVLIGGTPCQSFSVAGKRAGLDDARGNLALEFIRLTQRLRPRWIIWENVKGVLSIDEGRIFEAFLGALAQCGYGFAYRVLDAQFDALAQRRERVFVVGYLGDWRPPAAVLFERESLRRDTAPRRKAGEEVAGCLRSGSVGGSSHGKLSESDQVPMVSMALNAHGGAGRMDGELEIFIVAPLTSANHYGDQDARESQLVVETLRSHPRPGSNTVGSIAFDSKQSSNDAGKLSPTLRAMGHKDSHANGGGEIAAHIGQAVRRLTPMEWERLMGFPPIRKEFSICVHQQVPALAGIPNPKSHSAVGSAGKSTSKRSVKSAEPPLPTSNQSAGPHALVTVHVNLDSLAVEIRSPERSPSNVSNADLTSRFPHQIRHGDFAHLVALIAQLLDRQTLSGGEESPLNMIDSFNRQNGGPVARLSGREIGGLANSAKEFTMALKNATTFITSSDGLPSQKVEQSLKILCCYVSIAISSYIQNQTPPDYSLEIRCEMTGGYTNIPYPRAKQAKDGPRYKAIGNSISVPTLRWIGQRIQTVEEVLAGLSNLSTQTRDK